MFEHFKGEDYSTDISSGAAAGAAAVALFAYVNKMLCYKNRLSSFLIRVEAKRHYYYLRHMFHMERFVVHRKKTKL